MVTGVYLNWGADYGQKYVIQICNNTINWTEGYTNNTGNDGIDRIGIAASGRYVRILRLLSGTGNRYDLLDFTVIVSRPPPTLNLNQNLPGSFNLTRPVSSTLFALETTASLLPPVNWTPVTNLITNLNGGNSSRVTPGPGNLFFRLRQQP